MENNKEIGKLLREKLENFDQTPNDFVWTNIEKELDKKKKRRFIWWFFPALFIGGLGFGLYFKFDSNANLNPIKIEEEAKNSFNENDKITNKKSNVLLEKPQENAADIINIHELKNSEKIDSTKTTTTKSSISVNKSYRKTRKLIQSTDEYDVYEVTKKYKYVVKKKKTKIVTTKLHSKKEQLKSLRKSKSQNQKRQQKNIKSAKVYDTEIDNQNKKQASEIVENTNSNPEPTLIPEIKKPLEIKKIIKKEIKKITEKDTTKTAEIQEDNFLSCYLTPYFGPNYYNTFGNGNGVSKKFYSNSKSGLIGFNYGLLARTMLNDKIGFRIGFGVKKVEYETAISLNSQPLFDYNLIEFSQTNNDSSIKNTFKDSQQIIINQKISYLEMPIEGYYIWSDKQLGWATSAGISLLYINDNSLMMKSENVSEYQIGRSKNISLVGTTANLGFHFTYKLSDRINLELSPQFQYQLSGFEDSNDFKPLIISLNSGFSYKLF